MKFKSNYIIIPLLTIVVALLGKSITRTCDSWIWYQSLQLPAITPPEWVFPIAWNVIFVCTAVAALIVWTRFDRNGIFWAIIGLFCANATLNVLWTVLFFGNHLIGAALLTAITLEIITIALAALVYKRSFLTALLFAPYIVWCAFAIYLNSMIWYLN